MSLLTGYCIPTQAAVKSMCIGHYNATDRKKGRRCPGLISIMFYVLIARFYSSANSSLEFVNRNPWERTIILWACIAKIRIENTYYVFAFSLKKGIVNTNLKVDAV